MRGVRLLAAAAGVAFACGGDATTHSSNAAPLLDCPPTRNISDVSDPASTASGAAMNIMSVYCSGCHGPDATRPAPSGPSDPTDFNGMIDDGFVVDCDAEGSRIIVGMRAQEMPPLEYLGFPATEPDIDTVARFIEFQCSDLEKACAANPSEPGCDQVLAARRERRCSWWRALAEGTAPAPTSP
jgi:mono/diheme cytochrome c family protein